MTTLWGIVNVTPDSFSDGGRHLDPDDAIAYGRLLHEQGAAVLDVGGESTRPARSGWTLREEQRRILPVIEGLSALGLTVSIDTLNASTAVLAVLAGARFVNDVSGGLSDPDMLSAVAETDAEIVLGTGGAFCGHVRRGTYAQVGREVAAELLERVEAAAEAGIAPARTVVDPGIGFAKTAAQSWELLRGLDRVVALGPRVLVGTSRKRLLTAPLGDGASRERRDAATAVTSALAARAGAWAVRVHDVAASRDALAVLAAWDG